MLPKTQDANKTYADAVRPMPNKPTESSSGGHAASVRAIRNAEKPMQDTTVGAGPSVQTRNGNAVRPEAADISALIGDSIAKAFAPLISRLDSLEQKISRRSISFGDQIARGEEGRSKQRARSAEASTLGATRRAVQRIY